MAAPVNYYWGDVLTTGNTTMQQSLTVLGQPYFVANIQSATDSTAIIGVASTPFLNIYATQSNVGTANLTTPLSVPFLPLSANLLASNAVQTTNVTSTTSNIARAVTTTAALESVGTGGATFNLSGNVYTGSMNTTSVYASTGNMALVNTRTLVTSTIGATGATVGLSGNLYVSNALSTTNISATSANISARANISAVTAGQVLVNGPGASTFSSIGNAYISNSISTSNISGAAPASVAYANVQDISNLNVTGIPMSNAWAYVPFSGNSNETLTGNLTNPTLSGSVSYSANGGPGDGPYLDLFDSNLAYTVNSGLDLADTVTPGPSTESFVVSFWFKLLYNPSVITTQATILSLVTPPNDQINIILAANGTFGYEYYTAMGGWSSPSVGPVAQNNKWHFISLYWSGNTFEPFYDGVSGGAATPPIPSITRINKIVFGSRVNGSQPIWTMVPYGISGLRIFKSLSSKFFDLQVGSCQLAQLDARNYFENRVLGNVAASNSIMISDSAIATVMQGSTMNTASIPRLSITFPRPWILINFDGGAQDTGTGGVVDPIYTYNGILPGSGSWRKNGPGGAPSMYLDGVSYSPIYLNWTLSRWARPLWNTNIGQLQTPWWDDFNGLTASIWVKFDGPPPLSGYAAALFTIGVKQPGQPTGCFGVVLGDPNNYTDAPALNLLTQTNGGYSVETSSLSRAPGIWFNVVMVLTAGNQTLRLYIDGMLAATVDNNIYFASAPYYISESMHIGRTPDNNSTFAATGLSYIETSRLAVFDREFTASEVSTLYTLNAAQVENQVAANIDKAVTASNAVTVPSLVAYGSLGATTMNVDTLPTVSFNLKLDPIINFDFDGRLTSSVLNPFIGAASGSNYTYKRTGGPGGGPSIYLPGWGDPYSPSYGSLTWVTDYLPIRYTGFSISLWFKITPNTQNYSPDPYNYSDLFVWSSASSPGSWGSRTFNIICYTDGQINVVIPGASTVSSDGYACPQGEWNHVVVTGEPDGSGTITETIYVNGSVSGSIGYGIDLGSMGNNGLSILPRQDNIELADFKIFRRSLSATEVTKLYQMKGLGNQTTIFGNLSASNALTATNVFAQSATITTLNVSSVSSLSVRSPIVSPKWWIPLSYSLAEVNSRLSIDTSTNVSGATFTEGSPIGGGVAVFSAAGYSQGYLTSQGGTGLYFDNGITISCWVNNSQEQTYSDYVVMQTALVLLKVGVSSTGFYFEYDGQTVHFSAQSNGVNYNPPVTSNTWYHVVAQLGTYTGSDVYQTIWVNGVETTSYALRPINYPGSYAWNMLVGSGGTEMRMFDVRVYSSQISSTEIKALYEWKASPHTAPTRGNIYVSNSLSTTKVTGLGTANVSGSINVNSLTTKWPINQINGLIGQMDFAGSYTPTTGRLYYSSGSGTFTRSGPIGGASLVSASSLYYIMPPYFAELWSGTSISFWCRNAGTDFCILDSTYYGNQAVRFDSPDGITLNVRMLYDPTYGYIIPTISTTLPDSSWHHVCLNINYTYSGGADPSADLYIDGNFVQTQTGTGYAGATVNQFFEGNLYFSSTDIASFKMFSKVLSASEIAAIASPGVANLSDLTVYGNISVANSFSTGNLLTANMNATTLNTSSWSINTFSYANLDVQNLTTVSANVETLNAASVTTVSLVTTGLTGLSNLTTGNGMSTNNIFASGTITYTEDLTKRSIHLRPSQANAAAIQGWIGATCNAADQPTGSYWVTSPAPLYANVAMPGPASRFKGGVLLPDGRVLFSPTISSNIAIFNPLDSSVSLVDFPASAVGSQMFGSGVLAPNGSVVFPPFNSGNAGVFNTSTYAWSNIARVRLASGLFGSSVLGPNGNVICVPYYSDNICEVNTNSDPPVLANICQAGGGVAVNKYNGGVLLPSGNVVLVPGGLANIGMYNPLSSPPICSNISLGYAGNFQGGVLVPDGNVLMIPNTSQSNVAVFNPRLLTISNIKYAGPSYMGGCLTPTGNVILCPNSGGSNIGLIDPTALTFSNIVGPGVIVGRGATLLPDGRVVLGSAASANIGILDTFTPAPVEFCLSPYVNKF